MYIISLKQHCLKKDIKALLMCIKHKITHIHTHIYDNV